MRSCNEPLRRSVCLGDGTLLHKESPLLDESFFDSMNKMDLDGCADFLHQTMFGAKLKETCAEPYETQRSPRFCSADKVEEDVSL